MEILGEVSGVLAFVLACVAAIYFSVHNRDMGIWVSFAAIVAAILSAFALKQDKLWKADAVVKSITGDIAGSPGLTLVLWVKPHLQNVDQRKYLFEIGSPEGIRFAAYASADNVFTLVLHDKKGEPYPLQIPLGPDGLAVEEWTNLACQIAVGTNFTTVRMFMNSHLVASRTIPFRVDVSSLGRDYKLNIGNSIQGNEGMSVHLCDVQLWDEAINSEQLRTIYKEKDSEPEKTVIPEPPKVKYIEGRDRGV